MPYGMNYDFLVCDFVEDQILIGQDDHAPDGGLACACADMWMLQQHVDDGLNAGLNAPRAPR